MAWQLVNEVTRRTGVKLTPSEWAVLVVIAEECRDPKTRTCALDRGEMATRTGRTADTVKRALQGLAKKGLETRVPVPGVKDSKGQPVYAWPGRPCTYKLPQLGPDPADEPAPAPEQPPKGGQTAPPKGGANRPPSGRRGAGRAPTRAEVGRARAAAVAACPECDEWGYLTAEGRAINHHPRAGYTQPSRYVDT